jgi:sugar O-acyltransferase (sialic acid O-acetyltransferase NeuD family)
VPSSLSTELAIVGADRDVIDLAQSMPGYRILGVIDKDRGVDAHGASYLGDDGSWSAIRKRHPELKVLITVDPPAARARLIELYGRQALTSLVAPDAYVSPHAHLGLGCLVQRGVRVLSGVTLGLAVKLHVGVTIHHDCAVGDVSTLAPGARLLGHVRLGERVYVGAEAVVLQTCTVGAGAVIGAGAVVTQDVPPGATVIGVPAREAARTGGLAAC